MNLSAMALARKSRKRARGSSLRRVVVVIAGFAMLLGLATGASATTKASSTPFRFAADLPFSGVNGFIGLGNYTPAKIGCEAVNQGGGVLGHTCVVDTVNDYSDPADAVPALRKEIASASGLVGVIGLLSNTGPALIPIALSSHLLAFSVAGESTYVNYPSPKYLYMMQPPDSAYGYAMAAEAQKLGYKHPAVLTTQTTDSAPTRDGIIRGLATFGIKPSINLIIAPTQSAYGTEASRLLAAKPDAIIYELDPATAGTFFRNLKTDANGNLTIPMISDAHATDPGFWQSVSPALGVSTLVKLSHLVISQGNPDTKNVSYIYLKRLYNNSKLQLPFNAGIDGDFFDMVILSALAANEAHSVNPSVFAPYIAKIATPSKGAVAVESYSQGVREIKLGKSVFYEGVAGLLNWTKSHSRVNSYGIYTLSSTGLAVATGQSISAQTIARALG